MIEIQSLGGLLGAQVRNIDLNRIDETDFTTIRQALLDYLVLYFPQQELSLDAHVALGRWFGELAPRHVVYPIPEGYENIMLIENGPMRPPDSEQWHKDMTFRPDPPHAAIMRALVVPPCGGDTLFANMNAVYENLSTHLQDFLQGLTAVHDFETGFRKQLEFNQEYDRLETIRAMPESERVSLHPVIQTHPLTGKKYLAIDDCFVSHIVELNQNESDSLLDILRAMIRKPRYQLRIRWQKNDLAIWDNICTQHYAVADYSEYRCMHRVTVNRYHGATVP